MVKFENMPEGYSKAKFVLNIFLNHIRSFLKVTFIHPWVKHDGFLRIKPGVLFRKRNIKLGKYVQFGYNCAVHNDLTVGSYVLFAPEVHITGRNDHNTDICCETIWASGRGENEPVLIGDDVWVGHRATILAGVKIGSGSVVAAGSLVISDIPDCEIWGGVPAKKIKDRFSTEDEKVRHLEYLQSKCK